MPREKLIPISVVERIVRKSKNRDELIENLSLSEEIIEEGECLTNPSSAFERIEELLDITPEDGATYEQRLYNIAKELQEISVKIEERLHANNFSSTSSSISSGIEELSDIRVEPDDVINITLIALHNKTWNDLDPMEQRRIEYLLKEIGVPY